MTAETTTPPVQPPPNQLECDLVMKGGITSGVVYPPLVLRLNEKGYRFRNIGGTSAGAIAAAVTAAAECGRDAEKGGFAKLEEISRKLREQGFVQNLFQPTGGTRPLMDTVFELRKRDGKGRVAAGARLGTLRRAVRYGKRLGKVLKEKNAGPYHSGSLTGGALAAAAAGVTAFLISSVFFITGLFFVGWWPMLLTCLVGFVCISVLLALGFCWLGAKLGGLAAGLHDLYRTLTLRAPENFYGLCSGLKEPGAHTRHEVLTDWLHGAIQELSGRARDADPLTFGDLWRWPEPRAGEDEEKRRGRRIDLRMVSANLSQNQPYVLPFERDELFIFKVGDLERLFPKGVVAHMVEKGKARVYTVDEDDDQQLVHCGIELPEGYCFLPQAKDLPVIFATRMSLSFPVLISMIPLYTISARAFPLEDKFRIEVKPRWPKKWDALPKTRYGQTPIVPPHRKAEYELETTEVIQLRKWEEKSRSWIRPTRPHPIEEDSLETALQKNWFSDGGICSNFPIHFFDAWLPTRPTFGVNLTSQMGGGLKRPAPAQTGDMAGAAVASALDKEPAVAERVIKETVRSRSSVPTLQCEQRAGAAVERTPYADDREVFLPRPDDVIPPEWIAIDGLGKLVESVFRTAQNYRDNMQAALPSYRERIVQVRLTDQEGGLNLDMSADTLEAVARKGADAGAELAARFDDLRLRAHKWVRFRVLMKQMESQLVEMNRIMREDPFYRKILQQDKEFDTTGLPYVPSDFMPVPPDVEGWRLQILKRLLHIGDVIRTFEEDGQVFACEPQPLPEPVLRVTPRI